MSQVATDFRVVVICISLMVLAVIASLRIDKVERRLDTLEKNSVSTNEELAE